MKRKINQVLNLKKNGTYSFELEFIQFFTLRDKNILVLLCYLFVFVIEALKLFQKEEQPTRDGKCPGIGVRDGLNDINSSLQSILQLDR